MASKFLHFHIVKPNDEIKWTLPYPRHFEIILERKCTSLNFLDLFSHFGLLKSTLVVKDLKKKPKWIYGKVKMNMR